MAKKQKKCPPCEEGAPSWMVTYSDMVTLLLTFFIMIFATGQVRPIEIQLILSPFTDSMGFFEGGQTLSKGRMEEMGMTVESLPSQTKGRSMSRARREAQSIFQPEIQAKQVRVTEDERGLVISLIGADFFQPGSAILTPSLEEILGRVSSLLINLQRYTRIEGHAARGEDAILIGSEEAAGREERLYSNSWDLSAARATNAVVHMQSQGVSASIMQVVGYGAFRPLALEGDAGTPEAAAHNRRIDIVVLPFHSTDRGERDSGFRLPETRIPGLEQEIP